MFGIDWDMFEPFSTPLGSEDRFFIGIFLNILCKNEQISAFIMAGAKPRDFVHIVSGGGLRDPAERLRELQR